MVTIRQLAISFALVALFASGASAVTIRDLIKLKAAGLTDDVLIALIESDGSIFRLTADDILWLRDQGLSDKVIVAMVLTARRAAPLAVVEARPVQQAEPAPAPPAPVVHVTQEVTQRVEVPARTEIVHVPVAVPVPVFVPHRPVVTKPVEPVYWGWGGQRRPDSWREPEREKKEPPAKKPDVKKN